MQLQGTDVPSVFNPTSYSFYVYENATVVTVTGTIKATDANAGQTNSASLGWGIFSFDWMDQEVGFTGAFSVNANTGVVAVAKGLAYEQHSSYALTARATDGGGQFSTAVVTVSICHVNKAPTDITLSNSAVNEGENNAVVGTLTAVYPDANDPHTFVVTSTSPFTITNSQLVSTQALYHSTVTSYAVTIKATDSVGLSFTKTLIVTVNQVSKAPANMTVTSISSVVIVG